MTHTFDDVRKIVAELLGVDPVELDLKNKSQAMEILTRGAHNYALDKAARAVCGALKSCGDQTGWASGHHPSCEEVRAAILREKAR